MYHLTYCVWHLPGRADTISPDITLHCTGLGWVEVEIFFIQNTVYNLQRTSSQILISSHKYIFQESRLYCVLAVTIVEHMV